MAVFKDEQTIQAPRASRKPAQRQIRSHKKSRAGCKNCKLRKIRCDESRPNCVKCCNFGLDCDYNPTANEFQISVENVSEMSVINAPLETRQMVLQTINAQLNSNARTYVDGGQIFQFKSSDLELFYTFQTRTVITLGTPESLELYQRVLPRLACQHPYLMHMVLGMTTLHTRCLKGNLSSGQTPVETYHWFKATELFNKKLNSQIYPEDRDALWATAILLGSSMLTSCDASSPEEAWPLKSPSSRDLDWLRVTDGKKAIWDIANPNREDSVFHCLAEQYRRDYFMTESNLEGLPDGLLELCGIDAQSSNLGNNPYHGALSTLAPLLQMQCTKTTIMRFLSFIAYFEAGFLQLLINKDPRAVLLLGFWFAKVCRYEWWIAGRATVECKAICLYLERYCSDHAALLDCVRLLRSTYDIK